MQVGARLSAAVAFLTAPTPYAGEVWRWSDKAPLFRTFTTVAGKPGMFAEPAGRF
ncbi:hypothetical protein GCM10023107_35230 [Actinoplanes octamycinicus]|nr:hypothetical protein Aoc01nite_28450 [Actinoplanes octamycinicus]